MLDTVSTILTVASMALDVALIVLLIKSLKKKK